MAVSERLARASRIMSWFSAAGTVLVPAGTVFCFLAPHLARMLGADLDHHGLSHLTLAVPLADRAIALLFALIPAGIATFGLAMLTRLLRLFARGKVFGADSLHALGLITAALFWNVVAAFVMEAPISWFLTRWQPHAELQLTIMSDDIQILFLAGVAWVVARVLAEARRLADENASFV
ncbi:MAG: DUF2975 domain-containing protein [Rhizomicrobium sp.]